MDLIDGLETKDYIVAPVGTAQRQWRRYSLETTLCYRRNHRVCYFRLYAQTCLQLPFRQWGAGNVYLLVLSS